MGGEGGGVPGAEGVEFGGEEGGETSDEDIESILDGVLGLEETEEPEAGAELDDDEEPTDEKLNALLGDVLGEEVARDKAEGRVLGGEGSEDEDATLEQAIRAEHPDWTDEQVAAEVAERRKAALGAGV